jgi:hypothetical protein
MRRCRSRRGPTLRRPRRCRAFIRRRQRRCRLPGPFRRWATALQPRRARPHRRSRRLLRRYPDPARPSTTLRRGGGQHMTGRRGSHLGSGYLACPQPQIPAPGPTHVHVKPRRSSSATSRLAVASSEPWHPSCGPRSSSATALRPGRPSQPGAVPPPTNAATTRSTGPVPLSGTSAESERSTLSASQHFSRAAGRRSLPNAHHRSTKSRAHPGCRLPVASHGVART